MAKKIVAFSAGKTNGNTETYMKIALEEARNMGCDVELIRLNSCDLRPCKACLNMPCMAKGPAGCILKDDGLGLRRNSLKAMDSFLVLLSGLLLLPVLYPISVIAFSDLRPMWLEQNCTVHQNG